MNLSPRKSLPGQHHLCQWWKSWPCRFFGSIKAMPILWPFLHSKEIGRNAWPFLFFGGLTFCHEYLGIWEDFFVGFPWCFYHLITCSFGRVEFWGWVGGHWNWPPVWTGRLGFVLRKFAPAIGQMISDKVQSGSLIYMGRTQFQGLTERNCCWWFRNPARKPPKGCKIMG